MNTGIILYIPYRYYLFQEISYTTEFGSVALHGSLLNISTPHHPRLRAFVIFGFHSRSNGQDVLSGGTLFAVDILTHQTVTDTVSLFLKVFCIVGLITKYHSGEHIKNNVGGACSTYGGGERCTQDFGGET
jgi:hypothetical protein